MTTSQLLKDWQLNAGATEEAIHQAALSLGCALPDDYMQFLRDHDGGEGFIGENYLILWRAEELSAFNREYEVDEYAPGLLLFGSDGGGEAYGFDKRNPAMPVVSVSFIGMDLNDVQQVAINFTDLLAELAK